MQFVMDPVQSALYSVVALQKDGKTHEEMQCHWNWASAELEHCSRT